MSFSPSDFIDPLITHSEYLWQSLQAGPPEALAVFLIIAIATPPLFVLRTLTTVLLRSLGLSHPAHYRLWPRLPWRAVFKIWLAIKRWKEQVFRFGKLATGGFASVPAVLTLMYTPSKVFLGRVYAWGFGLLQPIGLSVSRHIFCYAMTGAGKSVWLIAMLSLWRGSAWIIDPKGQVRDALRRVDKRHWVVFEPYGETTDGFNPFDDIKAAILREGGSAAIKWATRVAQALVVTPAGSRQPYFTDTARGFLVGLILHVLSMHEETEHHLGYARELIVHGYRVYGEDGALDSSPEDSRELLFKMMRENPAFDGAVAGGVAALISTGKETMGNVLSTLQEQTKWLDITSVANMLKTTTRPLSDAKTRDDVVFAFCAPVLSIREELAPLTRLLTNLTAYTFESVQEKKGQCLMVADELQAQGYNATIEVILPVFRSLGVTFVGIAQDEEGMKAAYPKTYQAFRGNADFTLWMATAHPSNLEALRKALGEKTHVEVDRRSRRRTRRNVPVMDVDQIGRFLEPGKGNVIVTRAGQRAVKLKLDPYFTALPVTRYDADPDHRERFLRAITRFFLNRNPQS